MKKSLFLSLFIIVGAILFLISCSDSSVLSAGQKISGTVSSSDNYWMIHDPYTHEVTEMGYSKDYWFVSKKGATYTVTFSASTSHARLEDDAGGSFFWQDGTVRSEVLLSKGNPQTVTWDTGTEGSNKIDVEADIDYVPFDFTLEIDQP